MEHVMEQAKDWLSFYHLHGGQAYEIILSTYLILGLIGSFAYFLLFHARCLKGLDLNRRDDRESRQPIPPLIVYWRLMLLYYFAMFGLLLWIKFVFHLKMALFPAAYSSLLTVVSLLAAVALFVIFIVRFERHFVPKETQQEAPARRPGTWVFKGRTRSQLLPLFFFGFFGFLIVNGLIFFMGTSAVGILWERPYIVEGKVVSRKFYQTKRRYFITLKVKEARFVTSTGSPGGKVIHPGMMEFQTSSKIYKQAKGKRVVLLAANGLSMSNAVALFKILRTNGSAQVSRVPRRPPSRRRP